MNINIEDPELRGENFIELRDGGSLKNYEDFLRHMAAEQFSLASLASLTFNK